MIDLQNVYELGFRAGLRGDNLRSALEQHVWTRNEADEFQRGYLEGSRSVKPLSECSDAELAELWTSGQLRVVDCGACSLDIEQKEI